MSQRPCACRLSVYVSQLYISPLIVATPGQSAPECQFGRSSEYFSSSSQSSVRSCPASVQPPLTSRISGASAETEVEEVEDSGPALEAQAPHTKPWSPLVNQARGQWPGQYNPQGLGRPWNAGPWSRPWRPQPRQWSGPMGHVVPSFSGPRQNNGLWQAPPPVVQQVTPSYLRIAPSISISTLI